MKAALQMAPSEGKSPGSSSVEASQALCEHVQRQGLQCHLFSDITLAFCGKDHLLHRIILSQSSYFHSLLSGPWRERGKSRIELQIDDPNVTPEGLEVAFSYMYGVSPIFTGDNVIAVLAAGCFLCLENLCEKSVQFIVEDLKVATFVGYQQLSERHCYGRFADAIRNACWTFLCTHASGELLHLLPKFSLQVLCLLLKSDELWVSSESERYRLSKQALIEWKQARVKPTSDSPGCTNQKKPRTKPSSTKKKARNAPLAGTRSKNSAQKATQMSIKQRAGRKKESAAAVTEEDDPASPVKEEEVVTDLKKLQKLWEADDPADESFKMVSDLFTGGGIIFAHMEADEVLQAKKELEDAGLPTDAANDSIWQHVMLKLRVRKSRDTHNLPDESSDDEDDEEMDDDEDDDYDEVDDEDEDDSSEDSSDSDGWSTDHSSQVEGDDDSNSSDVGRDGTTGTSGQACKRLKMQSTSLVCFSYADSAGIADTLGGGDGKRRRTTGGFTWAVKPDIGMQLSDFPPFRFGAEFIYKDKRWTACGDLKSRAGFYGGSSEVFYGGSMWKIVGSNLNQEKEDWVFGVQCRPLDTCEPHTYQDNRKKVPFMAKLYVKTCQGLRCVQGTAVRKMQHHSSQIRHSVSIQLSWKDVVENEPLRISAVVQLIDD